MPENGIVQNEKVAYRVIEGSAVLVNPESSSLYWLNAVATRIWELADGRNSAEQMALVLCEEFEVDLETAIRDTEKMVRKFSDMGMLKPGQ